MTKVLLDLNHPEFQKDWFALERQEALAVLATLNKYAVIKIHRALERTGHETDVNPSASKHVCRG